MDIIAFSDGDKIGVVNEEKTALMESEFIVRYRENSETAGRNDEWKFGGEGAVFRGDAARYAAKEEIFAFVNGVQPVGGKIAYAFTVNGSSGVYFKDAADPKAREEHVLTSAKEEFLSVSGTKELFAVTVRRDELTSSIATLDPRTSELKTLTEGDSRDANPSFSPLEKSLLYFDSAGVGRTADGVFSGKYAPAAILSLDLESLEIKEVLRDKKDSYVKPKMAQNGDLYCIRRPNREKSGGSVLSDILLFPFRILKGIFGFLQAFVSTFGNTSLTTAAAGGDNPAKGRKTDSRRLFIDGRRVEIEKEYRKNQKTKDKDCGFIPLSWKLVRVSQGGEETVKAGICDFALLKDGGLVCTNGRHVFRIKDGTCKKIADAEMCLSVGAEVPAADAPFGDL